MSTGHHQRYFRAAYFCIFLGPLLAAAVVIALSPNYSRPDQATTRNGPIGGDFLQEWIGGGIVASHQSEHLYDTAWTQARQHDPERVGFRWDRREYFPMVYPPFYYWLVSPLSALNLRDAAIVWCVINALAFSLGLTWLAFTLRHRLQRGVWLVALSTLYYPLLLSLGMGQKSGILLLLLSATFCLAHRGRKFASGIAFGCLAFKPHLALLAGPALLIKRQIVFTVGALLVFGVAAGVSFGMGGAACRGFWNVCRQVGNYSGHAGYSFADAQNIWGAVPFAMEAWAPRWSLPASIALACGVVATVAWILRGRLDVTSRRFGFQFSALVLGTILLSPHFFTYDLSIVLIPLWIASALIASDWRTRARSLNRHEFIWRAQHVAILGLVFVGGGLIPRLSGATHIPIAPVLLFWWLVVLANEPAVSSDRCESLGVTQPEMPTIRRASVPVSIADRACEDRRDSIVV